MPAISLDEFPYLVVRYRAENLNTDRTDYLVYLNDGIPNKELHAIRLCDVAADGQWHVAAVDLTELTQADEVNKLAVQVQAGREGKARLWLKSIALVDVLPEKAEIIRRTPAEMLSSLMILKPPIEPSRSTCVPPQNSRLNASVIRCSSSAPTATTRTSLPYFSPNNAIAPSFWAWSIGMTVHVTGKSAAIFSLTNFSTSFNCFAVGALGCVKSNRK